MTTGWRFARMDRFSRIVLGYHGCEAAFAEALIRGEMRVEDWQPSHNPYDWLGHGLYFWEFTPQGEDMGRSAVGASLQLGLCLDLTDVITRTCFARSTRWFDRPVGGRGAVAENKGAAPRSGLLDYQRIRQGQRAGTGSSSRRFGVRFWRGGRPFPARGSAGSRTSDRRS